MEEDKYTKDLEKITSNNIVKQNLIKASIYLSIFELLKSAIETRIKNFLCISQPMNEDFEYEPSQQYRDEIINRRIPELGGNKNIYYASCLWLKDNNVITDEEVIKLQEIRYHRNKIGHEMPSLLIDSDHDIDMELFIAIAPLLRKIERWWILEFEMPANEEFDDFDYSKVNIDEIKSGRTILLDHLIEIVKDDIYS